MDWIIHLDTDELLHPAGAHEYSLRHLLSDVPGKIDMVIFPNYVSESASNVILVVQCKEFLHIMLYAYWLLSLLHIY